MPAPAGSPRLLRRFGLRDRRAFCALPKIIDVSGDERQKHMRLRYPVATFDAIRARAEDMAVTINALAIETDGVGLAEYVERRVMLGETAFVIPIRSMQDFGDAIVQKLQWELLATGDMATKPRRM